MKALIEADQCEVFLLAAGFGERLRPLTDHTPKPLITVGGKTLIERNLELIARAGFGRVFINLHWLGDKIRDYVGDGSRWGLRIEYSPENPILDTGGGIKFIETRLKAPLLMTINSDIVVGPDCSLADFLDAHRSNPASPAATMVVRSSPDAAAFGAIGILPSGEVARFVGQEFERGQGGALIPGGPADQATATPVIEDTIFTGIQILTRRVFGYMPAPGIPFGITRQTYPRMLAAGERVWSVKFQGYWNDVGTPERLERASKEVSGIFSVP